MNKEQFLKALQDALKKLPMEERLRTISYYGELIDDRIENGENEYAVIESLGTVAGIAGDILSEEGKSLSQKSRSGPGVGTIILLVLGFPLWGTFLLVGAVLLLVIFILIFVPVLVLGSVALACLAAALLGLVGTPFLALEVGVAGFPSVLFQIGLSLAALGLSLLSAVGLFYTATGTARAAKAIWMGCISLFHKRRGSL